MKEEIIGLLKYCGTFNISKTNITTIEKYLDYITELGYIDVSIGDNEFEAIKLIVQDYIDLQTENTKLKQDKQELQKIVEALEMAKQNMPKGTQFVIVAEEDYLRNIGIINERNKLGE